MVHLDGVRVSAERWIGAEGEGFTIAHAALDSGRLGISACATGLAQAALDVAVGYAKQREQFGKPITDHEGLGFLLADMTAAVESARATYLAAARRRDARLDYTRAASVAKLVSTDNAMQVTTDAIQVLGGAGYTRDFPVEHYFREAKVDADLRGHQPNPAGHRPTACQVAVVGGAYPVTARTRRLPPVSTRWS